MRLRAPMSKTFRPEQRAIARNVAVWLPSMLQTEKIKKKIPFISYEASLSETKIILIANDLKSQEYFEEG